MTYPDIVYSYHQFDDLPCFDPLVLDCVVTIILYNILSGKRNPVVKYFTCYITKNNNPALTTFGLVRTILVNEIIDLSTLDNGNIS